MRGIRKINAYKIVEIKECVKLLLFFFLFDTFLIEIAFFLFGPLFAQVLESNQTSHKISIETKWAFCFIFAPRHGAACPNTYTFSYMNGNFKCTKSDSKTSFVIA